MTVQNNLIPEMFCVSPYSDKAPRVNTVGDLQKLLTRLPDDLPVGDVSVATRERVFGNSFASTSMSASVTVQNNEDTAHTEPFLRIVEL